MLKEKIVLFEIPIYKMSEQKHREKWLTTLSKSAKLYRRTKEEQEKYVGDMMYFKNPQNIWKYNQIIGYIKIYLWHNDMCFALYLCKKKRLRFDSFKKDFIEDVTPSGSRFFIDSKFSNQDIIDKMNERLNLLIKYRLKKSWYIDFKIYNFLHKEINYIRIIQENQN